MQISNLAPLIDHTLLRPNTTSLEITRLCQEAQDYGFASVCIPPYFVPLAAKLLQNSTARVCTVIGFPLGADLTATKHLAAVQALAAGASEIDMVINISALKSQDYQTVETEVNGLSALVRANKAILKVIIETCLLNSAEKIWVCEMVKRSQAAFIKTSTGLSTHGATVEDVHLIHSVVGSTPAIKASGGIKDLAFAQQLVSAGASRLGTSSGIAILNESQQQSHRTTGQDHQEQY